MQLDVRVPIGVMFAIIGVLLAVYGLITWTDVEFYRRSLGLQRQSRVGPFHGRLRSDHVGVSSPRRKT